jgi:hypothetical protein
VIDIIKRYLLVGTAIIAGLVILLGFFIRLPAIDNTRSILLGWAVILAGVALFIGLVNLIIVHSRKVIDKKPGSVYSAVLLVSFVITLLIGLITGPTSEGSLWIFNYVQVPIETSLLGILAVVLILGAVRLLYRRPTSFSMIFMITALIILLGTVSIPWINVSWLSVASGWISRVPVIAGARGILLGVVLGTVATGLRVLMGADRPYED